MVSVVERLFAVKKLSANLYPGMAVGQSAKPQRLPFCTISSISDRSLRLLSFESFDIGSLSVSRRDLSKYSDSMFGG